MTFVKWTFIFVVVFSIAFVIIVTFSQTPFRQTASAVIFTYHTKSLPLYLYVAGALGVGLLIGFLTAAYYFITLKAAIFKRERRIKKLEEDLAIATQRPAAPQNASLPDAH
jgi:uncharacterized membrane protein YciS (DUF1049 family)